MDILIPNLINYDLVRGLIPDLLMDASGNKDLQVNRISSLTSPSSGSLLFCSKSGVDVASLVENIEGCIILVGEDISLGSDKHLWLRVSNPRLAFCKLTPGPRPTPTVHSSAVVSREAKIGERAHIGPNVVIGNAIIGDDVVLGPGVVIGDNVVIGNRVMIKAGAVLGGSGFGFEKDAEGVYHEFFHRGGVVIEDDVQIGSNTCIDRGALGNTLIKQGAKIDNLVHIAHNCIIGKNAMVIALSEVSGSVKIGDGAWISPSVSILNGVNIGDNAFLGIGSICTKNIEADHRLIPSFSTIKPPKNET